MNLALLEILWLPADFAAECNSEIKSSRVIFSYKFWNPQEIFCEFCSAGKFVGENPQVILHKISWIFIIDILQIITLVYFWISDILGEFLDEKGLVMRESSFAGDIKDNMELLEASHLVIEGENILEQVKKFTINWLKDTLTSSSINIDEQSNLVVQRVVHALELPSHWRVPWFDVKWHFRQYQTEKHMNPILFELAKLNFNIIQAKLQKEVKELSRYIYILRRHKESVPKIYMATN